MRIGLLVVLIAAFAIGCSKGEEQAPAGGETAEPAEPKKRSNIERIKMAVPYGKQVACENVFDPATFSAAVGIEAGEMKDKGPSNRDASLSCAFHRGGEPPKDNAQLRKLEKEGVKLGVLPGDEYCMVTAYCSQANNVENLKTTCEQRNDSMNDSAVGQPACVHQTERGVEYAYTYRVVHPTTQCLLEVMGGPSVTDEQLVQNCTRTALDDLTSGELTNFR
jgi:hypothetical protein